MFLTSFQCSTAGSSLLRLGPEATGVGRYPEIAVVSNMKMIPAHAALLTKNIFSPRSAHRQ